MTGDHMTMKRILVTAVALAMALGIPAWAEPTPTPTEAPESSVTAPAEAATSEEAPSPSPTPESEPSPAAPTTLPDDAPTAVAPETETTPVTPNSSAPTPFAGANENPAAPSVQLQVKSSVGGDTFRASTGSYVFTGTAPVGAVAIEYTNVAHVPVTWHRMRTTTTTNADGSFRLESGIGPWLSEFKWRVVSLAEPSLPPSAEQYTKIEPGLVISASSSVGGAVFRAAHGSYVFTGFAPPGPVQLWWKAASTDWVASVSTTSDAAGRYRIELPIGPWANTYQWRVTSPATAVLGAADPVTTAIQPGATLTVTSSVNDTTFRASTGSYVFTGFAPPGQVALEYTNTAHTPTAWHRMATLTANAAGAFSHQSPIGPWLSTFQWRVVSLAAPALPASASSTTQIQPGVTLAVTSSTTGTRFEPGNGNYVFTGFAPPGGVDLWFRTTATDWIYNRSTTADSTGRFQVEAPIGPWINTYIWRATSKVDTRLDPSDQVVTRVGSDTMSSSVRPATLTDLGAAYRSGCPVGPASLSVITMTHWGFDGQVHDGELIVRTSDVNATLAVFSAGFNAKFPIRQMVNPRHFGANDITMMEADNTSAFNCRQVVGNPYRVSPHSYGYAVDINPRENPYYAAGVWYPSSGSAYISRSTRRPGMHFSDTVFPAQFVRNGGHWGGSYSDYHHFELRPR